MGGVLYSFKVPALALACALFATTASASIQLDQSDIPLSGPVPIYSIQGTGLTPDGAGFGQSVTAGLTGVLARIDLLVFASMYGSDRGGFTVAVEKTPGVTLATRHMDFSALPNFDLSSNYSIIPQFDFRSEGIQLVTGETFNIVVTADAGSIWSDAAYFYFIGAYDGGKGFLRNQNGDFQYFGDLDQGFRTYVDVGGNVGGEGNGVPEPSLWATLILGFGLTGATLRRRQSSAC